MTAVATRLRRIIRPIGRDAGARSSVEPSRLHSIDLVGIGTIGLRLRPVRSLLTGFGIAIGIAAIVGILAVSESSRADLLASLDRLGTNLLTIAPGQTFKGQAATLPEKAAAMIERIGPVEAVSEVGTVDATVRRTDLIAAEVTSGISVVAADLRLLDTLHGSVATGTFLNAATAQYPAVVLGVTAARRLGIDRVDVTVWLGERRFTVVGILDPLELAPNLDVAAMIGYPIAGSLFGQDGTASTIYVRADPAAVTDVWAVLAQTANPANPSEADVARPSDALVARAAAADAYTALFVGLGAIALFVAGVGIANAMLMTVLERRSEIGLRRALGATRRLIALQFVAEALTLAFLGGVLGVLIGVAIAVGYALLQGWAVVIPPLALGGGLAAALSVGAIAGFYPAARAARVSPTDALRGV